MRAYFARHVGTYGEVAPMPCEDCQHSGFCRLNSGSCKVSRHWETYGKVLMKHRTGWHLKQGKEREPAERVPDGNIVIEKHSWNK
jgi:hypothetical protein